MGLVKYLETFKEYDTIRKYLVSFYIKKSNYGLSCIIVEPDREVLVVVALVCKRCYERLSACSFKKKNKENLY